MIKKTDTTFEASGSTAKIMSDLAMIMRRLVERGVLEDKDIDECVRVSRLSDKEIEERAREIAKKKLDAIIRGCSGSVNKAKTDAEPLADDPAKQIVDVVTKAVREMLDEKKEE